MDISINKPLGVRRFLVTEEISGQLGNIVRGGVLCCVVLCVVCCVLRSIGVCWLTNETSRSISGWPMKGCS